MSEGAPDFYDHINYFIDYRVHSESAPPQGVVYPF